MVIDNSPPETLDRIFHALANETRRDIVRRAVAGDESVSGLAREYDMSVTAVQKHVTVLEDAGLVSKQRRGREQIVTTRPAGLDEARTALDELAELWRGRLERFEAILGTTTESDT